MEPSLQDRIVVIILIIGVACFSLTPAFYLVFRAFQWDEGLRALEVAFFPLFLFFGAGALLAYRRRRARQAQLEAEYDAQFADWDDPANGHHEQPER